LEGCLAAWNSEHRIIFDDLMRALKHELHYSPYAKGNFCFERVISGWRGALTVLDLRLKK
jgi:hypothetical protein